MKELIFMYYDKLVKKIGTVGATIVLILGSLMLINIIFWIVSFLFYGMYGFAYLFVYLVSFLIIGFVLYVIITDSLNKKK